MGVCPTRTGSASQGKGFRQMTVSLTHVLSAFPSALSCEKLSELSPSINRMKLN